MKIEDQFNNKIVQPYKKRRKLLNLQILQKVYHIKKIYLILILFSIIFFIFNRSYFLFIVLTGISSIFSYYHSKVNRTPMDLKLTLFLGIFITRYYGILFTVIFFIISDVIPDLLGGESIEASTLIFMVWYFIINSVVYFFPNISLFILGPILVIIEAIGSFFINSFFGIPGLMSIFVAILTSMVRIVYFLTLGRILEGLFLTLGIL